MTDLAVPEMDCARPVSDHVQEVKVKRFARVLRLEREVRVPVDLQLVEVVAEREVSCLSERVLYKQQNNIICISEKFPFFTDMCQAKCP